MPVQQQEIEFSNLLERHNQTINCICIRYCGGDAFYFDELRQECAMAIWTEFSRYGCNRLRSSRAEATWIQQISYHAVVNYQRKPYHPKNQSSCDTDSLVHLPDSQSSDNWNLLDDLTAQLNNRERILLDHYLLGDSYATIAHSEGITEANARQRMSRLIKKLKMLIHK